MARVQMIGAALLGLIAGITLIIACDDNAPRPADAAPAVCDCPVAETPIAGRVVLEQFSDVGSLPPEGGFASVSKDCQNLNAVILSGGCSVRNGQGHVTLVES